MTCLVDDLARLLERTYDIDFPVGPLGRFVVGEQGHALLTARRRVVERIDDARGGARLLLRRLERGGWAVALYLPAALVARLEQHDPRHELNEENAPDFATLVEEVDHLVTFADRAAHGADISLLELEWHAVVSQYLVLAHFIGRLAGRPRLQDHERAFLARHVFDADVDAPDPEVSARYRRARRLGALTIEDLRPCPAVERVRRLRRFHRASLQQKLARLSA